LDAYRATAGPAIGSAAKTQTTLSDYIAAWFRPILLATNLRFPVALPSIP
jgi:hypothetical protein